MCTSDANSWSRALSIDVVSSTCLKLCSELLDWLAFDVFGSQVARLIYTNTGLAILALASNAVHKLWKWPKTDRNVSGKVWPQPEHPSKNVFKSMYFVMLSVAMLFSRQLQLLLHRYGNLPVEYWWLMKPVMQIQKKLFTVLHYQRTIRMSCLRLVERYLFSIWCRSRWLSSAFINYSFHNCFQWLPEAVYLIKYRRWQLSCLHHQQPLSLLFIRRIIMSLR